MINISSGWAINYPFSYVIKTGETRNEIILGWRWFCTFPHFSSILFSPNSETIRWCSLWDERFFISVACDKHFDAYIIQGGRRQSGSEVVLRWVVTPLSPLLAGGWLAVSGGQSVPVSAPRAAHTMGQHGLRSTTRGLPGFTENKLFKLKKKSCSSQRYNSPNPHKTSWLQIKIAFRKWSCAWGSPTVFLHIVEGGHSGPGGRQINLWKCTKKEVTALWT